MASADIISFAIVELNVKYLGERLPNCSLLFTVISVLFFLFSVFFILWGIEPDTFGVHDIHRPPLHYLFAVIYKISND